MFLGFCATLGDALRCCFSALARFSERYFTLFV